MFHHVEQATTYMCGPKGWQFNKDGIRITIPPGAVKSHMGVTVGVTLAGLGPFVFPPKMKPVSPLLFACVGGSKFSFKKPVEITLPHCVRNTLGRQRNLQFLKAGHRITSKNKFSFQPTDGSALFSPDDQRGTLQTNHFCLLCIAEKLDIEEISNAEYALMEVVPRPITRVCGIVVCVIFALPTCKKVILLK